MTRDDHCCDESRDSVAGPTSIDYPCSHRAGGGGGDDGDGAKAKAKPNAGDCRLLPVKSMRRTTS